MAFLDLFDSKEKKQRLSHIQNLLILSGRDGEISKVEVDFILNIAIQRGVTPDEFSRILNRPESISFHPPVNFNEKVDQLFDLVAVMMIDGVIDEDEVIYCKSMAEKLGFNHRIIDKIVDTIINGFVNHLAREVVLNQIFNSIAKNR